MAAVAVARPKALAFDVFGTLVEVAGLAEGLPGRLPERARLAAAWRRHQLEITWLLSLMRRYEDFEAVTRYALEATLAEEGLELTEPERWRALAAPAALHAFGDAELALEPGADAGAFRAAAEGHVLAEARLSGTYERP